MCLDPWIIEKVRNLTEIRNHHEINIKPSRQLLNKIQSSVVITGQSVLQQAFIYSLSQINSDVKSGQNFVVYSTIGRFEPGG